MASNKQGWLLASQHVTYGGQLAGQLTQCNAIAASLLAAHERDAEVGGHQPAPGGGQEPPFKKQKVDHLPTIPAEAQVSADSIGEALIAEAPLIAGAKVNQVALQVRANKKIYVVVHKGEGHLKNHFLLGAFGKGSFRLVKGDEVVKENELEFKLGGSEDLICVGGDVVTLGEVIHKQAQTKPDCVICYHKRSHEVTNFTCEQTHKIVFTIKGGESSVTQSNICAQENIAFWVGLHWVRVLWVCRWTQRGLMPVRPEVRLAGSTSLVAGTAVLLNGSG